FEIHNQDLKEDGGAVLEGSTAGVEERTEEMDTYNTMLLSRKHECPFNNSREMNGGIEKQRLINVMSSQINNLKESVNSLGSKKVEFGTSSVFNGTNNSFRENENNRNVNSGLGDGTNFKANDYRELKHWTVKSLIMFRCEALLVGTVGVKENYTVSIMEGLEKGGLDGTARAYVALFEKLAGQLVGVSEQVLEATFIKGLKSDLRASV
ncbi:hypothetical protein Tco_0429097, partial [Tanacetum coccineum]